jgi:uncharacterized protein (DUF2062 family)
MRSWIQRWLPSEESLKAHPRLRWMGPLLRRPWLWQLSRHRVALGAGIGVFFGFLIPVLQIVVAAVFAVLLRANLPVAVIATLVTNPLTFAPVFVAAYRTGSSMLDEAVLPAAAAALADPATALAEATDAPPAERAGWIERARAIGKPLFLGLAVFAVVGGALTWLVVHLAWTVGVWLRRRRRRRRRVRAS